MNYIKTILKNNKRYLKSMLLLLILGLLIGFLLTKKINYNSTLEQIKNIEEYLNNNKINFIFNHIMIISILYLASLTIIGIILFPLNIVYEGICISFNIFTFTKVFKLNGFIYSLIYNLLSKGIYLLLLIIIFKKLLSIIKTLLNKNAKLEKKETIIKKLKQIGIYSCLILINDMLIFFLANKILSFFLFIIL